MANNVSDYAKSSCDCYKCSDKKYKLPTSGIPSNMAVYDCKFPLGCNNNIVFKQHNGPFLKTGTTNLNPQVRTQKYAKDFNGIRCSANKNCPKLQFASTDPRLISASHSGQVQTLNVPPLDCSVELNSIAMDKSLNNYGQSYKSYADINTGDLMYYTDKSREDAFYSPVFALPATTTASLFTDPMGTIKPQYNRKFLVNNDPLGPPRNEYQGCLSWMQDSMSFREDLISKQMASENKSRWMPRWSK